MLELKAIDDYRKAIADCEAAKDYVTRDLFADILKDEEGHLDHLNTMLQMIELQGLQNFIQLQSSPADESESCSSVDRAFGFLRGRHEYR